ncbi:MAG TPA: hypothetical protein VIO32_01980 [Candidatus Baltobacteraceae bacterium]
MERNADLIDLLRALNAAGAEYLLVGGYALAFHGRVRATKDVDIFIGTDPANAHRVWEALRVFGAPLDGLVEQDLTRPGTFFIMGRHQTKSTSLPPSTRCRSSRPGETVSSRAMVTNRQITSGEPT